MHDSTKASSVQPMAINFPGKGGRDNSGITHTKHALLEAEGGCSPTPKQEKPPHSQGLFAYKPINRERISCRKGGKESQITHKVKSTYCLLLLFFLEMLAKEKGEEREERLIIT